MTITYDGGGKGVPAQDIKIRVNLSAQVDRFFGAADATANVKSIIATVAT